MHGKKTVPKKDLIAAEIRNELRSILRQLGDLRRPLDRFERLTNPNPGQPSLYVHFDDRPRRRIGGLRIQTEKLVLPDERIADAVLSLAKSVWHLKDRLHQWARANSLTVDIEAHARNYPDLLICADLANWKKHGRSGNFSKCKPRLDIVHFDTSGAGVIELFYEGATKDKELLVSNPVPIPWKIPILVHDGTERLGDAVAIIAQAFEFWGLLIDQIGVLNRTDRETSVLRRELGLV